MSHDTKCTEWNRFTAPTDIECVCGDAFKQLRAELERVTAERGEAVQHRNAAQAENVTLRVALAETKAARAQDRERDTRTMQDLLDINSETLDATYRELAEARAALERTERADRVHPDEHVAALYELDQLRRAWALRELRNGNGGSGDWLERLCANVPAPVAALIRSGAGYQIAECDECHQRAPVREVTIDGASACVCAWPCSEKGARDGE